MSKRIHVDLSEVIRLYEEEYLTCAEIAPIVGCSDDTIRLRLKDANVQLRPGIKRAACTGQEAEIIRLYCNEKLTLKSIANITGIGKETIRVYLLRNNISIRSRSETRRGKKFSDAFKQKMSIVRQKVFADPTKRKRILAAMLAGRKTHNFSNKMRETHTGPKNPNWHGGISFKPYCPKWTEALRESVREEFGRTCFLCPTIEAENGRKLSVHHANFDKMAGCYGKRWNLVPLCQKCHNKSSNHRFEYFNLLVNHWAYKYIQDGINI